MTDIRLATIKQRGVQIVTAGLENHAKLSRLPPALAVRPLNGAPVMIVGAGPSLDRNAHLIPEWQRRGGLVFCGSNALGALHSRGIRADVCVAVEALDVSHHLRGKARSMRILAIDASCHPRIADIAVRRGPERACWFMPAEPRYLEQCAELGVPPLHHGGATSTAAAALAVAWGCGDIVLVGMDLAFAEGKAYASGAGWSGLTATKQEDGRMRFDGREDREAVHLASGTAPVPRQRALIEVPAWGSGEGTATVQTSVDYEEQRQWLGRLAEESTLWIYNCTEGGARIPGAWHMSLSETLSAVTFKRRRTRIRLPLPRGPRLVAEHPNALALVSEMQSPTGRLGSLPAMRGTPTVEALAAADVLRMRDVGMSASGRLNTTYDIWKVAAEVVGKRFE